MTAQDLVSYRQGATRPHEAPASRHWRIDGAGDCWVRQNPPGTVRPDDIDDVYWLAEAEPTQPNKHLRPPQLAALLTYLSTLTDLRAVERHEAEGVEGGSWYRLDLLTPAGPRVYEVNSPHRADIDTLLMPILTILQAPS